MFLKNLNPLRRIRELTQELGRTRRERDQARQESERLQRESERLQEENQRLEDELKRLRKELEAVQRGAKRQAAPFSRGQPKSDPKPPGRKPGTAYGRHHRRPIPDFIDEDIQVAAPEQCPKCGGPLTVERVESQYWDAPEPGRDLPGHPAGGAQGGSHLACAAGCGAAQRAGAHGRDRLEGGSAVALAVGRGQRTGYLL